jgi:hypothetical protein
VIRQVQEASTQVDRRASNYDALARLAGLYDVASDYRSQQITEQLQVTDFRLPKSSRRGHHLNGRVVRDDDRQVVAPVSEGDPKLGRARCPWLQLDGGAGTVLAGVPRCSVPRYVLPMPVQHGQHVAAGHLALAPSQGRNYFLDQSELEWPGGLLPCCEPR